MPRFGLAEGARFGAKLRRMSAGQTLDVQPQMNHFVLENLEQRDLAVASSHAADFVGRASVKSVYQQRNGKRNHARLHADIARRPRETTAPADLAIRQNGIEKFGVDLAV